MTAQVEQWGIFELALPASAAGNPFLDVELPTYRKTGVLPC
jgi:hypothetical protein